MEVQGNTGKVIDQAYDIIRKTYQEITTMKNDIFNILNEISPGYEFYEEYSFGPKSLYLKETQTYVFEKTIDGAQEASKYMGLVVLFSTTGERRKISSIDGPEVWFCFLNVKNRKDRFRWWHIADLVSPDERENISGRNLESNGNVFTYHWENQESGEVEEWKGEIIGFSLTEIKDKPFIQGLLSKFSDL